MNRRHFTASAMALAASVTWLPLTAIGADAGTENGWRAALRKIVGEAGLTEARVNFEMPFVARNDSPFRMEVWIDSPMTEADYVTAVHILATKCDEPRIASFYFTPRSGKAMASTRIRLDRSQKLIAVARMNDGAWYLGRRLIKISNSAYAP